MRKTAYLFTILFCALILLWGVVFGWVRETDIQAYRSEQRRKEDLSMKSVAKTAQQNRKGVTKEIYLTQESGLQLHYRVQSDSSTLTLKPEGSRFNLIEQLHQMRCWMQEKLENTEKGYTQQLRYLEAEEGIYRYTSQQFLAQTVTLSLYHLPGRILPREKHPGTPFLSGVAQDIRFAVAGKSPQFQAENFKASLTQKSGDKT